MVTPSNAIDNAATAIAQLRPGNHLCQLYDTEDEHRAVLTPFMQHGLEQNERVVYVADFHTPTEILKYLNDVGVDTAAYQARDQLRLLSPAEAYVRDGAFNPRSMIALLEQETELALRDGYAALRITGEMTWALRGLPGSDRLIEYEIALDRFFEAHSALALCQYDRRRFSPETLLRVVEVHRSVIVGTAICDNFYFVPPDDVGRPDYAERHLQRQLGTLTDRRRLELELWQQRRQLEQEVLSRTRDLEESNQQLQREVEQHQQTAEALRQSTAFLKQTQRITQVGGWEYNVASGQVIWSDEVYRIHEVGPDYNPSDIHQALSFYAPHDQAQIDRAFQRAVELGEPYDLELQFVSATGRAKWVRTIGQVQRVGGQVNRVFGTIMDVTDRKQSEEALRVSEARFRTAQEMSLEAFTILRSVRDAQGQIVDFEWTYANPAAERILKRSLEDLIGRRLLDVLPGNRENHALFERYARIAAGGQSDEVELEYRSESIVGWFRNMTVRLDDGVAVSFSDVTEHKQALAALRASEERYRRIFETAEEGIWLIDADSRTTLVNDKLARMLGYTADEMVGQPLFAFMDESGKTSAAANVERRRQGIVEQHDFKFKHRDGHDVWAWLSTNPLLNHAGEYQGALAMVTDITQRRQAEQTLQARLRLAQFAVDHTLHEVLVATLDEVGQLTGSPIGFYHLLDSDQQSLTLQAWSTRTTTEFCTAAGQGQHYNIDQAGVWVDCVRERRPIIHNDYAALPVSRRKGLPSGHARVDRELVVPVFRGDLIVAILGVGNKLQPYDDQDLATVSLLADLAWEVVERKVAETARRDSEERYRAVVSASPLAIAVLQNGRFIFANSSLKEMIGTTDESDIIGRPVLDFIDPDYHPLVTERFQNLAGERHNPPVELKMRRPDGSVYYGETISVPITLNDQPAALVMGQDITERKRLADAEHEQRTLAEALRDVATVLNSTLNLDEVLDRILLSIGRVVPHDAVSIMLLNADQDMAYVARYHGYAEPGTESQVRALQFSVAKTRNLHTMHESGQPLVIEDTQLYAGWATGLGRGWIRSSAGMPIRSRGRVIGFLSLYSSVPGFYTEAQADRLQAFASQAAIAMENAQLHTLIQMHVDELEQRVAERTHELIEANQKLAAANVRLTELDRLKDEFLSRISHELRTPLTSIRIYLDLLENGKPEKREKYLRTLNEQAERLQGLIESLLDVSRLNVTTSDVQLRPIDLNRAAGELVNDGLPAATRRGLKLFLTTEAALSVVLADALLLPQALSPILSNALAYTPAGGTITVSTAAQSADGRDWGTLTVCDTGPGIDASETDLIFQRFYRGTATRDYKTPGTGLGLSISRDLIEKCGGRITVESVLGQGAAFTVWLPLATGPDNSSSAK